MRKKAQIQNMETITVVIIVIILIIFGIVYASNQKKQSLLEERERIKDMEAMVITTNALNMDFITCTLAGSSEETCVDYYKIKALEKNVFKEDNYLYFYYLFQDSKIEINILKNITDPTSVNEKILIYNATNMENKSRILIKTPITVKDVTQNINYFGIMEVTAYR